MAEFTQDQILEIKKIIGDQYKMKGLNWKIVQSIPSILEPNTLYFHQVSISPKNFELYHTDKDGDLSKISILSEKVTSPDATDLSSAIVLLNELKQKFNNL